MGDMATPWNQLSGAFFRLRSATLYHVFRQVVTAWLAVKGNGSPGQAAVGFTPVSILETDHRADGYFEVIPSAVVEVDFVAHFEPHTDGPPEAFHSSTGIQSKLCTAVVHGAQRPYETGRRILIGNAEIHEPHLTGGVGPERPGASLELGAKQSGKRAQVSVHKLGRDTIRKGAGVAAFEVVGHLGFQLNVGTEVQRGAASYSDKVNMRISSTKVQIVDECSH